MAARTRWTRGGVDKWNWREFLRACTAGDRLPAYFLIDISKRFVSHWLHRFCQALSPWIAHNHRFGGKKSVLNVSFSGGVRFLTIQPCNPALDRTIWRNSCTAARPYVLHSHVDDRFEYVNVGSGTSQTLRAIRAVKQAFSLTFLIPFL